MSLYQSTLTIRKIIQYEIYFNGKLLIFHQIGVIANDLVYSKAAVFIKVHHSVQFFLNENLIKIFTKLNECNICKLLKILGPTKVNFFLF